MTNIYVNTDENIEWFKKNCRCYDLSIRSVCNRNQTYYLLFLGGITVSASVQPVLQGLATDPDSMIFLNASVTSATTLEEAYTMMLQGQTVIFRLNSPF